MDAIKLPAQKLSCLNLSQGQWMPGSGAPFDIDSPYWGQVIASSNHSTASDIDAMVAFASQAQRTWKDVPIKERTQIFFKWREILLQQIPEIAQLISLENGKTVAESQAGLMKGVEVLEYAISLQNADVGGRMEVSRGVYCEYRREPIGVVTSITPFNFPAMVPMWTLPIALILGNAYIWKPSEKTPLTSVAIAKTLEQAGLPKGLLSIAHGGKPTVDALLAHPGVQAAAFVGSSPVAKYIYGTAATHGKRVLALGGAKNHIILLPDADPKLTGRGISDSFTGCAGQRCMAASVLLAVGQVDHLIQAIVERAQSMRLGEDMGAIITKEQVAFLHKAIAKAEAAGAKVILDGRKVASPKNYPGGYWLGPTILDRVDASWEAAQSELFGPILSIVRCENLSQALEREAHNPFGNAASVFTSSGAAAELVAKRASSGMVGVNIGVPVPREPFSFGGINLSKFGHGDITGEHCLDFWTHMKKITSKWEWQSDLNWMS